MHRHLRVGLALGPSMGWVGLGWVELGRVSDFFCPSLLCLPVLGPSLSFRCVLYTLPFFLLTFPCSVLPFPYFSLLFPTLTIFFATSHFPCISVFFSVYHLYFTCFLCRDFLSFLCPPLSFFRRFTILPLFFLYFASPSSVRFLPILCLEWRYSGMLHPYYSGSRCLDVLDF